MHTAAGQQGWRWGGVVRQRSSVVYNRQRIDVDSRWKVDSGRWKAPQQKQTVEGVKSIFKLK
eukprot:scaffold261_cov318-Chaetoceros_neogracile.AAC.3